MTTIKLIYLDSVGHARVEDIKSRYMVVEHIDGFHTFSNRAVFRDMKHRANPIAVLWQGVTNAEGMAKPGEESKMTEIGEKLPVSIYSRLIKIRDIQNHRSKVPISRRFGRLLSTWLLWVARAMFFTIAMMVIIGFTVVIFAFLGL